MGGIVKHALVGCAIGLGVAALPWLAWFLHVLPADSSHMLASSSIFGVVGAGLAAAAVALVHHRKMNPHALAATPIQPGATRALADIDGSRLPGKHGAISGTGPRTQRRLAASRGCLALVTPALRWRRLSEPAARLLRTSAADLAGKPIFHRVHPEDIAALDAAFARARSAGELVSAFCRFLVESPSPHQKPHGASLRSDTKLLPPLKASSFVYTRLHIRARRHPNGKVRRFACRFTDLTDAVLQRERELHVTRKDLAAVKKRLRIVGLDLARLKMSYRELYQNAPVMYFSVNVDGKLVTVNDTLLDTLGYQRQELQDRDYTALLCPDALGNYVTIAERMPAHEGERETQWRKKDGTLIDVWLHSVPVYDEFGRFVRCRSAALDMTEKNRLAGELRSRGVELERTNQRLRTINSELEAFTHVVSHDLKEPLRTLQAYSHLLAEEHAARLGADGFQYVNHLVRASRRLGALIDELLNLSQAGRITRAAQPFNLIQVVATVRQDLVSLIQRRDANIVTEGSLPDVSGDPARITQLLANLVANGLKYNQHPTPTIVIGAAPCHEDPTRVTIFVRDNGIGIDPAFHQQVFGIFRRLHQPDQYEGTGAGLAICKKIVEAHGGRIWVESAPGQGATFFFTLPRVPPVARLGPAPAPDTAPSAARRGAGAIQPSTAAAPIRDVRIVVVDDQSDVGRIIEKLARRDGLAVQWFPSAEDAWPHLQEHRADLVLLDVNLPGMSGVDLCRRLREHAATAEIPVALFTPDQDAEKLAELRAAGADFFLTKDLLCEPAQWQQKIQELLAQIRATGR